MVEIAFFVPDKSYAQIYGLFERYGNNFGVVLRHLIEQKRAHVVKFQKFFYRVELIGANHDLRLHSRAGKCLFYVNMLIRIRLEKYDFFVLQIGEINAVPFCQPVPRADAEAKLRVADMQRVEFFRRHLVNDCNPQVKRVVFHALCNLQGA